MSKAKAEKKDPDQVTEPTSFTQFVIDLASLMYMQTIMAQEVKWNELSSTDKATWCSHAASALSSLDKMNREIIEKRDIKKEEYQFNRNITILKTIIENFIAQLKVFKCPECGKDRKIKIGLFPSEELAHKIFNCEVK